jgi:hypothetical protein
MGELITILKNEHRVNSLHNDMTNLCTNVSHWMFHDNRIMLDVILPFSFLPIMEYDWYNRCKSPQGNTLYKTSRLRTLQVILHAKYLCFWQFVLYVWILRTVIIIYVNVYKLKSGQTIYTHDMLFIKGQQSESKYLSFVIEVLLTESD